MSEALVVVNPAPPGTLVQSEADGRADLAKLPEDWRVAVGYFCLTKLYLIRTRGPLVMNLSYWIKKGLTLDDAKAVFRRLCDPDVARTHNFENQLMADMAGLVADALRRRKQQAEAARRREAHAAGEKAKAERPADGTIIGLADHWKAPDPPTRGVGARHE